MIFTANILIDLCLIFAVWKVSKDRRVVRHPAFFHETVYKTNDKKTRAKLDQVYIKLKIAEKTADRAFQMASQASLSCIALQKSLAMPRLLTKNQINQNKLAKKQVDDILGDNDMFSWMRPTLSDEDNELLDDVLKEKEKRELNGGSID